jgi:hypothetical protein
MSFKSLFSIEIIDGQIKVSPSEELKSMPIDQQISALQRELQEYEAKLQNEDSNKCELELVIVILKNFLNQFREANWERINQ